jgi:hypothetical protein
MHDVSVLAQGVLTAVLAGKNDTELELEVV